MLHERRISCTTNNINIKNVSFMNDRTVPKIVNEDN